MQAPYPLLKYKRISSKFGWRWFLFKKKKIVDFHNGWDFSADEGTPVLANVDGICYVGYDKGGFGNYILIVGKTPQENIYRVYFGHLKNESIRVNNEQRIKAGTIIAEVGSTGLSTNFHLHWEFRIFKNGKFVALDPKGILKETKNGYKNAL